MTNHACLVLPFPPSVNALYSTNKRTHRRFKSKRYEAWEEGADAWLLEQSPLPRIKGAFNAVFSFGRPDKRKRDVTNLIKAPEDLLVKHGVIEDDSLAESVLARWDKDVVGVRVEIVPCE